MAGEVTYSAPGGSTSGGDTSGGCTAHLRCGGCSHTVLWVNTTPDHQNPAPLRTGQDAFVTQSVANIWREPLEPRPGIDEAVLGAHTDMTAWTDAMSETASRTWLMGKLDTQALLGTRVVIDRIDGDWARVLVPQQAEPSETRGYPGWVPTTHLAQDARYAHLQRTGPIATVTASFASPSAGRGVQDGGTQLSFLTELPILEGTEPTATEVRLALPGGKDVVLPRGDVRVRLIGDQVPAPEAADVLTTARRFLGLRYLWAGVSAWGYDCSGFTYSMYRFHGVDLPRDAGPQLNASGYPLIDRADLEPGDLVFFSSGPGSDSIRHVTFYTGNDQILHAPNASKGIEEISLSGYDVKGEYAGAVRPLA